MRSVHVIALDIHFLLFDFSVSIVTYIWYALEFGE